jgi:hypothetical protein
MRQGSGPGSLQAGRVRGNIVSEARHSIRHSLQAEAELLATLELTMDMNSPEVNLSR